MTNGIKIAYCIIIAGLLQACKKNNDQASQNASGYFFKNTEWTGTCHTISQEYDRPCYLRFNGDTSVVVYSTFDLVINGAWTPTDSIRGKISKVDTLWPVRLSGPGHIFI